MAKWKKEHHPPVDVPEIANGNLDTIQEKEDEQLITPTVVTSEKVAAVKIFLETYYNDLLNKPSQRETRLRQLDNELWHLGSTVRPIDKERMRSQFFRHETNHLRETRVIRARTAKALTEGKAAASSCVNDYQPVKVLGKGSFGVVKLVRQKPKLGDDPKNRKVYAMKIIRKSGMLRTSQEGHLRAEKDFLVASEGSRW